MLHYSRHYSALTNGTNAAAQQAGGDLQNMDLTSESQLRVVKACWCLSLTGAH
jgi:hypothetical protein